MLTVERSFRRDHSMAQTFVGLSRKAKARTRKAQARIDEAGRLQDELADLDDRARSSGVGIDFSGTARQTVEFTAHAVAQRVA